MLTAGARGSLLRNAACLLACARHTGPQAALQDSLGDSDLGESPELQGRPLSPIVLQQSTSVLIRYAYEGGSLAQGRLCMLETKARCPHASFQSRTATRPPHQRPSPPAAPSSQAPSPADRCYLRSRLTASTSPASTRARMRQRSRAAAGCRCCAMSLTQRPRSTTISPSRQSRRRMMVATPQLKRKKPKQRRQHPRTRAAAGRATLGAPPRGGGSTSS